MNFKESQPSRIWLWSPKSISIPYHKSILRTKFLDICIVLILIFHKLSLLLYSLTSYNSAVPIIAPLLSFVWSIFNELALSSSICFEACIKNLPLNFVFHFLSSIDFFPETSSSANGCFKDKHFMRGNDISCFSSLKYVFVDRNKIQHYYMKPFRFY